MAAGDAQRLAQQSAALVFTTVEQAALGVECRGQRLGQVERLGDLKREFDRLGGAVDIADEIRHPPELRRHQRELGVTRSTGQRVVGRAHQIVGLADAHLVAQHLRGAGLGARGGPPVAQLVEELDGLAQVGRGAFGETAFGRAVARPFEQFGPVARIVGELGSLLEEPARFASCGKRERLLAGPRERRARLRAQLARVGVSLPRAIGVQVVRRKPHRHLVVALPLRKVRGGRQMAELALAQRQRLVRHHPQQILDERQLSAVG